MSLNARKYISALVVAVAGLAAVAGGSDAHAQDRNAMEGVSEEIVVTAQRREQSAQDVPISLTVFSSEQLKELGVESTVDLAGFTPGLTIGQNTGDGDFAFVSLRGVTMRDFADTNESPSAVYLNEFYKANLMGLDQQLFDIGRVEVLRGPQGTLYGRNTTGGLIHYVASRPTRQADGYVDLTVGDYNQLKVEGALSGPISDTISARLSALHNEHDGWLDNVFAGNEDGNALDATSVRAQLLFSPSENSEFLLLAQYAYNDNEAGNMFPHVAVTQDPVTGLAVPNPGGPGFAGYIEATPNNPRDTNSNRDIALETDQITAIALGKWRFGDLELVSVTGYEETSKDGRSDSDGTPFNAGTEVHPRADQLSQEFRLSGSTEKLQWLTGIYYFAYDIDGMQRRCRPGTCDALRNPVLYDLETRSWAAFANVDFALTSNVGLTTGLRYTQEDKEYELNNMDFGFIFSQDTVGDLAKQDDDNVSFNVRLNWTPSDNVLTYAGVARGYKAGTFNVGFTPIATDAIPVDPEELTSYEVGFKSSNTNDTLQVNGAVFYYDYQDSQAFQFDGRTLSATTFNRDAEISGAELEVIARPVTDLNLRLAVTYLEDATLKDVELPGPTFSGLPPIDTRMPLTPEWDIAGLVRYEFGVPWGGRLALQGAANYLSEQYFDAFNSPSHLESSYTTVDARVSWYSEDDKWKVSVFAENLTDEEFRTYAFDLAFLGFATDVYGKPRWIGGTVSYSW